MKYTYKALTVAKYECFAVLLMGLKKFIPCNVIQIENLNQQFNQNHCSLKLLLLIYKCEFCGLENLIDVKNVHFNNSV